MYDKVSPTLDFVEQEKKIEQFWRDEKIFEKSIEARKKGEPYVFYDGPPTANGKPHIGHVLTRVIKDLIPRYRTMKGFMVPRKAGWDTHGLPVELEVEKELGLNGKDQIEAYGIAPFIGRCKESVWRYREMWEQFSRSVGFWADMENPYVTYHNSYIESEWWALKKIYDRGLLYKGLKTVPYCPRCGTPLSSHEVAQGYRNVKERSAIARFRAVGEDAYFLAWTTTPWTLPSNAALCVNPAENYCRVKAADGNIYYLGEPLLDAVLGVLRKEGRPAYEILERMKGKTLEYREYVPLFDCAEEICRKQRKKAHFILCDGYVSMTEGTGIVHIAPAFGEDDARIGEKYDLPFIQLVDSAGLMTEETPFAGTFVKDADPMVLAYLRDRNLLFSAPEFEHDYPFCWRCDTPLLYYVRDSWFIRMTAVRDELLKNNATIHWIPENIGKGRFGDWLENVQDWSLSRNRYWGTPLNIWECACGERLCVGSVAELRSLSDNCPENIELHRPYIDGVVIPCPKCGGEMHRVPEVIDCWFDSGSMPFAQHHYPFENRETFAREFPADFISEAVDQTRGWFYSLLAVSTLLFDRAPFKNCIVLGHVQDENGQKMSKSRGNAVDPMEALETYGADAIRWYFYSNSAPWLPNRFHGKAVVEGQRKFMGTLWNTYAFFVLYANIDSFDAAGCAVCPERLTVMDRWLLSRLNSTVKETDGHLAGFRIPEAARALQRFVDEMSNWYVRRCRERYWASGMEADKAAAYHTLYEALVTTAKMAAPMIPFLSEAIYRNLVRGIRPDAPESVHLCDFPTADESLIDVRLEEKMREIIGIVELGRAARNGAARKNRQPLAAMYVRCDREPDPFGREIIREELNIKKIVFTKETESFVSYRFRPQLKTLGPRFGKRLGEIRTLLEALDGLKARAELDAEGFLTLRTKDGDERLTGEDLLIETVQREGFYTVSDQEMTVAIDTALTPELIEEGFVREIISKIQTMRKEAGFNVTDRIRVTAATGDRLRRVLEKNRGEIAKVTLADDILSGDPEGTVREWDINGETAVIGVEVV